MKWIKTWEAKLNKPYHELSGLVEWKRLKDQSHLYFFTKQEVKSVRKLMQDLERSHIDECIILYDDEFDEYIDDFSWTDLLRALPTLNSIHLQINFNDSESQDDEDKSDIRYIYINKIQDDWYLVKTSCELDFIWDKARKTEYYKCDELDGLLKCLEDIIKMGGF